MPMSRAEMLETMTYREIPLSHFAGERKRKKKGNESHFVPHKVAVCRSTDFPRLLSFPPRNYVSVLSLFFINVP